jgi:hypothetical protein
MSYVQWSKQLQWAIQMFSHFLLDTENKFAKLEDPTFHLALIRLQRIFAEQEEPPKNTNIQGEIDKI